MPTRQGFSPAKNDCTSRRRSRRFRTTAPDASTPDVAPATGTTPTTAVAPPAPETTAPPPTAGASPPAAVGADDPTCSILQEVLDLVDDAAVRQAIKDEMRASGCPT
jgi:hypothetical protein